ncbi:MAG: hypothetical protein M3Q56_08520 [Bacteroidota bacterium]|nr:hypothetical protein [Bacteroidota bacterium]
MKNLILGGLFIIFLSCTINYKPISSFQSEIIQADKAMSELAGQIGFLKALQEYAHDDMVKLNDGDFPIIGKKAFIEKYRDAQDTKSLQLSPIKAEVAESGELGYTWGNWILNQQDTTLFGNYFTVWKRNDYKTWRVVLDGGNNTPPPMDDK